jgi:exonuclease III
LQGTTETNNYAVIYTGVNRYTRSQSGVTIWIHKSISNNIEYYKCLNDRIIEIRLNILKRHSAILGVYGLTESREELNEEFYETLQKILDKANKSDNIIVTGGHEHQSRK